MMENRSNAPCLSEPVIAGNRVASSSRLHLDFLDGLRAILALIVVLDHAYVTIWPPSEFVSPQNPFPLLRYLYALGNLCVGSFLVVSGFCLMLPVVRSKGALKGGTVQFYQRRVRRILPPYYCAMLLALLPWMIKHHAVKLTYADVFSHLTLTHNLAPSTVFTINGAFWSIAVECQVYLLFPLLIFGWNRVGKIPTLLALACFGAVGSALLERGPFAGLSLYLYPMFALGMAAAWIAYDPSRQMAIWRERVPWKWICLVSTLVLGLLLHVLGLEKSMRSLSYLHWLTGVAVSALLVTGAQSPQGVNALNWKPLVTIGAFSYSLYLIHLPLLAWFTNFSGHRGTHSKTTAFVMLASVGVPLIILFAFGFFWFCERPFLPGSRQATR